MRILVTGARGFIGSKLVPRLIQQGHQVSTFGRSPLPDDLTYRPDKHFLGDISDSAAVSQAVSNCEVVYHLAGLVSYRKAVRDRQFEVNVLGTRNVMDASLKSGVSRVIHTSSIAGMGIPPGGEVADETFVYNLEGSGLNYCETKHQAELEVESYIAKGLPVLMLCPGIVLGEGDTHPHHKAIFMALSRGWLLGWPPGGVSFCDIEDVITAHLNALTLGKTGERYVLSSANLTYRQATGIVAGVLNVPEPRFEIPGFVIDLAGAFSETVFPLFGKKPALTRQVAWLSQRKIFFSAEKARCELNFPQTDFETTVRRIAPFYLKRSCRIDGNPAANAKT